MKSTRARTAVSAAGGKPSGHVHVCFVPSRVRPDRSRKGPLLRAARYVVAVATCQAQQALVAMYVQAGAEHALNSLTEHPV